MSDVDDFGGIGAATPPVRIREVGATSVACPMLTQTNYTVWSLRIKVVLRIHDVWSVIDTGEKNEKKNNLAMGLLYQAIPESLIMQIGEVDSSKELWELIKTRYVGAERVKEARLQTLAAEFDRISMRESETVDSFAGKLSEISSKSSSLGESITEEKLVKKLLKSVPSKFIHLVASLEQILDLKSVGYEDIVGRLKAYEERIKEDVPGRDDSRLLLANDGRSAGGGAGSRAAGSRSAAAAAAASSSCGAGSGYGCGGVRVQQGRRAQRAQSGYKENGLSESSGPGGSGSNGSNQNFWANQGGKPNSGNFDQNKPKKDFSKIICYRCDKSGHYASKCPDRIQKFQESNFCEHDDTDEAVFLHETVF